MAPKLLEFDTLEYLVFGLMLGISALIGVYFGFIKKGGQDTVDGYLLGGKQMGLFPISMSLISSFTSGITILGLPTEIYTYGSQYMTAALCHIPVGVICAFVFLPVFYKLQLISLYQYLEMRFNQKVRKMVSLFFTISLLIYIPIVILGPALALNQVSGLNVNGMSLLVCAVCIFYTTVGGLKAVVWTDTLQAVVMIGSCVFVSILGTERVGGLPAVFDAAFEGERLEFFNMDPNPFKRSSFWSVVIGMIVSWTAGSTISPSASQRYIALNTLTKAKWSVMIFCVGCIIFFALSCFMGFVIYAAYKSCDPLAAGMIRSADQILPYFIMDVAGSYRGVPGLFLAGVVSAALSTMSTGLNTVSGTLYEDFIEPLLGKTTEKRASTIMKLLSALFGIICVFLVMVIGNLGSLIELSNAVGTLTSGTILGIFILGMFLPQATNMGAIVGGLSGLGVMSWVIIGSRSAVVNGDLIYQVKPVAVDGCTSNITNIDLNTPEPASDRVFLLYQLSIFLYVPLGCVTTVIVGLISSYLTGPNRVEDVDRSLLSPVIHRFLPDYKPVPVRDKELHHINSLKDKRVGQLSPI